MTRAFRFDRPLGAERRRLAAALLDSALAALHDRALTPETRVHELRKYCKKLRALARLLHPRDGRALNLPLRDAARRISTVRDADVALETCQSLLGADEAAAGELRALMQHLRHHRERQLERQPVESCLASVGAELELVRCSVARWPDSKLSGKVIARGLGRTYRKARRAMAAVRQGGDDAAWHEWRKQVKYLRYQLEFVRRSWRAPLDSWRNDLHRLSDLIGQDHDLVALQHLVLREVPSAPDRVEPVRLGSLCAARSSALRGDALELGAKLFSDRPGRARRAFRSILPD